MASINNIWWPVTEQYFDAAHELLIAAFPSDEEAALVRRLRADGAMYSERAAFRDGKMVGYLALSKMVAPVGWLCLAPVAVIPERQRQGIGTAGVSLVAQEANVFGPPIVVLGGVPFYEPAGFSHARAQGLNTVHGVSHLLLAGPGADVPEETLVYPAAFEGLN